MSALAGVPSTCFFTRTVSRVSGSFSTYSTVRLSSAQTRSPEVPVIVSGSTAPVRRSLKRMTYWRRPTSSSAQASSWLSWLTSIEPTLK
ncbi:hypothetical protein D3C73_751110 [compost metagenome]